MFKVLASNRLSIGLEFPRLLRTKLPNLCGSVITYVRPRFTGAPLARSVLRIALALPAERFHSLAFPLPLSSVRLRVSAVRYWGDRGGALSSEAARSLSFRHKLMA